MLKYTGASTNSVTNDIHRTAYFTGFRHICYLPLVLYSVLLLEAASVCYEGLGSMEYTFIYSDTQFMIAVE